MSSLPPDKKILEAVKRDGEKPAIDRWNALIARGAIDSKGRVLLKAPKPMNCAGSKLPPSSKKPGKKSR